MCKLPIPAAGNFVVMETRVSSRVQKYIIYIYNIYIPIYTTYMCMYIIGGVFLLSIRGRNEGRKEGGGHC